MKNRPKGNFRFDGRIVDEKTFDAMSRKRRKKLGLDDLPANVAPAARCVQWPLQSDSYGVMNPDQVGEAKAKDRAAGYEIQYAPDGAAVFKDRDDFRRWRDAHRIMDLREQKGR